LTVESASVLPAMTTSAVDVEIRHNPSSPLPELPPLETDRNEIRCRNPIRPMIPPRAAEVFDASVSEG
jgi:hypothetical protein